MKGYFHIYTGNGKGKSTAAFGLALRAAGADLQVFIGQFLKGSRSSERESIEKLPNIILRQYGGSGFIRGVPSKKDIEQARIGLSEMCAIARSGKYRVVIMDEVNVALHYGLFPVQDLLEVIDGRHVSVELIFTGRNADPRVVERADLVTEMKEIKHYYQKGVQARVGIEK